MGTVGAGELRAGTALLLNGALYLVLEAQHVKPGKGGAFVRSRLRRLSDGAVLDRTYRVTDKIEETMLDTRPLRYLYRSGDAFHFMDAASFEEHTLSTDDLGKKSQFLIDDMEVAALVHEGRIVDITLPIFVELTIEHTDPGLRGDTSKSGTKPATLQTGLTVQVPLFIERGARIRIDTRTGTYVQRVESQGRP